MHDIHAVHVIDSMADALEDLLDLVLLSKSLFSDQIK